MKQPMPEREERSPILQFLHRSENHYLTGNEGVEVLTPSDRLPDKDIILFRVDEMTYEEKAPRKEALENVLSAARIPGVNFLYLLVGDTAGVKFYYGLSKDPALFDSKLNMPEIGISILKASLEGNFRGCKVCDVPPDKKNAILSCMREKMLYSSRLEGVPGTIKDNEEFQSADRLVNVMRGSRFCMLVVAQALQQEGLSSIEHTLNQAYSQLNTYVKYSLQVARNEGKSSSDTKSSGENWSHNTSHSDGTSSSGGKTEGTSKNTGYSKGSSNNSENGGEGSSQSKSETNGTSTQDSHSDAKGGSTGTSSQTGQTEGESEAVSREYLDKCAQEWIKYCDDVIFPRLDYSRGKGLFQYTCYLLTDNKSNQIKLENTVLSLYSGKQGNRVPLRTVPISRESPLRYAVNHCQIPMAQFREQPSQGEILGRSFLSQAVSQSRFPLGNWISTNELSMIAGLPQKEVVGMRLREMVDFGLNYREPDQRDRIEMGSLIQNGTVINKLPVSLSKQALDKHIFVTGVTGSGKTTTCQRILLQSGLPFLVVEPAKTEYRILRNEPECEDLLVFTLGNNEAAPFRLNPFEFMPRESITSHVDMIKASIEAAFDMEAAIPQLIEEALYACYEKKGWDISTNRNSRCKNPFAPDCEYFPTLSDLLEEIPKIVERQGFDDRLKDEYIGSIRARLTSLTLGAKGMMLNTSRSIDFRTLLDKKVVLELENIRNGAEKSLIMGFVLSAFNEAVYERFMEERKPHAHILLVEEAHRLLSRYMPGDSPNKKLSVETFTDMLAEIRKYGECLIIAEQIPNKLAPEVLKNTGTKIIHRLFAQDDKEAVGNTIALNDEQKRYLSYLESGQAVMFSERFGQAILVQIREQVKTSDVPPEDDSLTDAVMQYYIDREIIFPLSGDLSVLTEEQRRTARHFQMIGGPMAMLSQWKGSAKKCPERSYAELLEKMLEWKLTTVDEMAAWLYRKELHNAEREDRPDIELKLKDFLTEYPRKIGRTLRCEGLGKYV